MAELRAVTPDRVADLLSGCAPCTFWQTLPSNGHVSADDPLETLADWVARVGSDWGPPGRIAYVDGEPAGYVLVAPARHVPRLAAFPTAPADPATVMLLTAAVPRRNPGTALRKALVQAAAKEAARHRARAIEAIGARALARAPHGCVLQVPFLEEVGFRVEREHPAYPRLRMDLRTALTVREEAAELLSRALARVPGMRPVPQGPPDGATRARSTS
ncbi:MAG TPA: N-acetyltransferase [Intrasporangium sp.]|uniref:N-acetyltransferase n=1 Tax=Intrasporangium sp. TaxID=1925024 RepID=UPI002D77E3AC|nr:N-acetyltransferase [Intrasporangium sp.]HET7397499.1 N-acetyltransferase [Intrasporangium sp.]